MKTAEESMKKFTAQLGKTAGTLILYARFLDAKGLTDEFDQWAATDKFAMKLSKMILKGTIFDEEVNL